MRFASGHALTLTALGIAVMSIVMSPIVRVGTPSAAIAAAAPAASPRPCEEEAKHFYELETTKAFPQGTFPPGGDWFNGTTAAATPTPDSRYQLRIAKVQVKPLDTKPEGSCDQATSVDVAMRVSVRNVSYDPTFIIQNAKVLCGVYLDQRKSAMPAPSASPVPSPFVALDSNLKLSTMSFRFIFNHVRPQEEALSILFTGDKADPGSGFTPEGTASTSNFIPGARLGGCRVRING